jgi:hypothetical protein
MASAQLLNSKSLLTFFDYFPKRITIQRLSDHLNKLSLKLGVVGINITKEWILEILTNRNRMGIDSDSIDEENLLKDNVEGVLNYYINFAAMRSSLDPAILYNEFNKLYATRLPEMDWDDPYAGMYGGGGITKSKSKRSRKSKSKSKRSRKSKSNSKKSRKSKSNSKKSRKSKKN